MDDIVADDLTEHLHGHVVMVLSPPEENSISLIYRDGRMARFWVHPDDGRIALTVTELPQTQH